MQKIKKFENIILVPFFNDEQSLNILLEELKKEFLNQFYMVIVDDGSLKCKITSIGSILFSLFFLIGALIEKQ